MSDLPNGLGIVSSCYLSSSRDKRKKPPCKGGFFVENVLSLGVGEFSLGNFTQCGTIALFQNIQTLFQQGG